MNVDYDDWSENIDVSQNNTDCDSGYDEEQTYVMAHDKYLHNLHVKHRQELRENAAHDV